MIARSYYRHSGACPPLGLLRGLVMGLVASVLLAAVYVAFRHYVRMIVLGTLVTILTGALAALAGLRGLKQGEVRNDAAANLVALLCGLATFYTAWVLWVALLLHRPGIGMVPLVEVTKHPSVLWDTIVWINERGTWAMRGDAEPVAGFKLWLVWGLEALCLVGMGVVVSASANDAYCEACRLWCAEEENIGLMAAGDLDETRRRLKGGDLPYFLGLGRPAENALNWLTVKLSTCPGCRGLHTLTIVAARQNTYANLRVQDIFKNPTLMNRLILDDAGAEAVRQATRA